jgi:hypothetical protein
VRIHRLFSGNLHIAVGVVVLVELVQAGKTWKHTATRVYAKREKRKLSRRFAILALVISAIAMLLTVFGAK